MIFTFLGTKNKLAKSYLVDKKNLIYMVLFTALFSIQFIFLYKPFSGDVIYEETNTVGGYILAFLIIFTGIIILAISRFLMYHLVKKTPLTYLGYIVWCLCEIFVVSGFYTFYIMTVREDLNYWVWNDIITVFKETSYNTFLVIFLPYTISWLFFSYNDKKEKLKKLEASLSRKEIQPIPFYDENGEMRFTISQEKIIYLEAADNYVEINYINNNKITNILIRNTLKNLTHALENTIIRRCHRSYMINIEHIAAIRKNGTTIDLELDVENVKKIPVSKTYSDEISELFMNLQIAE